MPAGMASSDMFRLQQIRRTQWPAVSLGFGLFMAGIVFYAPLPRVAGAILVGAGLVVIVLGAVSHPRRDAKRLVVLKEEGTQVLNRDPMSYIPSGERRDQTIAVAALEFQILSWVEETLAELRRAGATDGEISDFLTIIKFEPIGPAISEHHAQVKGILSARLERLRPIISRLEGS